MEIVEMMSCRSSLADGRARKHRRRAQPHRHPHRRTEEPRVGGELLFGSLIRQRPLLGPNPVSVLECDCITRTTIEEETNLLQKQIGIRETNQQQSIKEERRRRLSKPCDQRRQRVARAQHSRTIWLLLLLLASFGSLAAPSSQQQQQPQSQNQNQNGSAASIIIDQQSFSGAQLLPASPVQQQQQQQSISVSQVHLQPSFVYGARNRSINFTHVALDELTGSIYLGATNWLFQLSIANLKAEFVLKTGPALENSRDCAPADCVAQLAHVEASSLPMHHGLNGDLAIPQLQQQSSLLHLHHRHRFGSPTMHTLAAATNSSNSSTSGAAYAFLAAPRARQTTSQQQQQAHNNNYNKILAIDQEARQLIVCGSLNQGACRRHQLGQLANFSELIPLPVASNDEHSSTVALVTSPGAGSGGSYLAGNRQQQQRALYVAATNSRLGVYREMVPAISARYLEPASRAMQIIESSFTDSARIDISFGLRDYYLVNYVHSFQHNDYIYFATVQRKSPSVQLEEWGYITRLARLCLNDLSFQSYAELTLECRAAGSPASPSSHKSASYYSSKQQPAINYNLLQDAYLTQASSHLAHQLGLRAHSSVFVGAFAQSKDHTTKSKQKSAICLFPMEKIEQKFNENIHLCYNGTSKSRNMDYIAGSVNDCPKAGKAGNIANFCNEPLKLNGSQPLTATPVIVYNEALITSIAATQAPTSPLNQHQQARLPAAAANTNSQRQHQVLLAGTGDGALKRIALVSGELGFGVRGIEFDSIQVDEHLQEPILADLHLYPANNPQVTGSAQPLASIEQQQQLESGQASTRSQFAVVATPYKVAKFRINSCSAISRRRQAGSLWRNSSVADECISCAKLQDPFCGWCATSGSCSTRDECGQQRAGAQAQPVHWSPFDQIKCADYQPLSPQFVPIQTSSHQPIEVNIRLHDSRAWREQQQLAGASSQQLALQLTQAQFTCHFDYLALSNRSAPIGRLSGATTKAAQARLNLHTSTVSIGCPLPPIAQRPNVAANQVGFARVRLTVRMIPGQQLDESSELSLKQALNLQASVATAASKDQQLETEIERELTFYDCSARLGCRSCLAAQADQPAPVGGWSCSWCPLSNKCTFNASHADFGCAASAIISTTPHSLSGLSGANSLRASQLAQSLDQAQASAFGVSIDRLAQCPADEQVRPSAMAGDGELLELLGSAEQRQHPLQQQQQAKVATNPAPASQQRAAEILVPNNSRRSVQVSLRQTLPAASASTKRKVECLVEIEGAKARLGAKLLESAGNQPLVVCQENLFVYHEETATQRAQLMVILNDNQVMEITDVILYKCHLFGVSPPALTSTVGQSAPLHQQHSSAAWPIGELLRLEGAGSGPIQQHSRQQQASLKRQASNSLLPPQSSDCSLCLNVERKYQCVWCANQCQHSDQCSELQASTCPPPRIDSVHPTSGPLEGGTLITIEGSNLGSNEREIQDKISVGGEACQLVMYSVSTRIVCKTGPSLHGPQAATVFVGNRAGVTSAHEKFHYKAVHLTDVHPRVGPVSGGTRLYLTGSNLNIGSRVQIFLDDIPCSLDSNHDITSNQISCVTAPNLLASSMRITKLTLMIDNSTHHLPYAFTYQPDPIITSIEPAESFVSGGRLIFIAGQHLASPQSTKLMVYHEHKHNIVNGTSCIIQNDTLITCLTPSLSKEMLASLVIPSSGGSQEEVEASNDSQQQRQQQPSPWSYELGGLKLKMSLFMDDVRSVRNLDEYYHHLPHYLTYYEDPQLFRLPNPIVEFSNELIISGENLGMKQLDQDMLITIGSHNYCRIKSLTAYQVICEPPQKVYPVYDENNHLIERPLLPIVALIGAYLKYPIGHMQYSSSQYQEHQQQQPPVLLSSHQMVSASSSDQQQQQQLNSFHHPSLMMGANHDQNGSPTNGKIASPSTTILISLSILGFIAGLAATFMFALSRFRQSKAEREYKRIQLQMGSLDANGQPILNGSLFENIRLNNNQAASPIGTQSAGSRALDYVGGAISGKKLFYQLNQQMASFPPSPLTDISSLAGSKSMASNNQQQHVVKLSSNGTIINSMAYQHHYSSATNSNSSQSSPGSTRNSGHHLFSSQQQQQQQANQNSFVRLQQQQQQLAAVDKSDLINGQVTNINGAGTARNFSWTQEAPSTIVPYAVIEACNLTLEGKNAIKDYV